MVFCSSYCSLAQSFLHTSSPTICSAYTLLKWVITLRDITVQSGIKTWYCNRRPMMKNSKL